MKRVLSLCTINSASSQIAGNLLRQKAGGEGDLKHLWIYLLAPMLGALSAVPLKGLIEARLPLQGTEEFLKETNT